MEVLDFHSASIGIPFWMQDCSHPRAATKETHRFKHTDPSFGGGGGVQVLWFSRRCVGGIPTQYSQPQPNSGIHLYSFPVLSKSHRNCFHNSPSCSVSPLVPFLHVSGIHIKVVASCFTTDSYLGLCFEGSLSTLLGFNGSRKENRNQSLRYYSVNTQTRALSFAWKWFPYCGWTSSHFAPPEKPWNDSIPL